MSKVTKKDIDTVDRILNKFDTVMLILFVEQCMKRLYNIHKDKRK